MTNLEKIHSMNADELVEFITNVYHEGYLDGQRDSLYGTMYDKDWLESEVSNNDEF